MDYGMGWVIANQMVLCIKQFSRQKMEKKKKKKSYKINANERERKKQE